MIQYLPPIPWAARFRESGDWSKGMFLRVYFLGFFMAVACTPSATHSTGSGGNDKWLDPPLPGVASAHVSLPAEYKDAIRAQGKEYKPRTHHLREDGSAEFTNRLIFESSPYLLQHAHNPVNWHSWGDDPFERAAAENKLVLLSVGYSTCHWCHVMERESFEDIEIAGYINANYIPVKVDREERPDVDNIYMSAVRMISGRGGWPMTVLLTSDRLPVFGGTYFPARDGDRGTRSGFLTILREYRDLYVQEPIDLVGRAQELAGQLSQRLDHRAGGSLPNADAVFKAVRGLSGSFDDVHGGFGNAPKFPRSVNVELLFRYYRRTQDKRALSIALTTLDKMAAGGMHDQIGGGFHRYSTDQRWLVPHFEKMLYDNAQLVASYLEASQLTGDDSYSRVATRILDYVAREMTHPKGPFYSATDADSPTGEGHDEEGLFFTWTISEVESLFKSKPGYARLIRTYYRMTARGNFEKRNILHTNQSLEVVAKSMKLPLEEAQRRLDEAEQMMYQERLKRLPPILDDKILVSWNGLMISAFARAGLVLARNDYIARASKAAEFVLSTVRNGKRLKRLYRSGQTKHDAYLDDYAFLIQGLLDLYEASSNPRWLNSATKLQVIQDQDFWDEKEGGYFFIGTETKVLLVREKPSYDGAEPSGNSVAALNLLRLEQLTGKGEYRNRAIRVFRAFSQSLMRYGRSVPKMLTALDYFLDEPVQVVIVQPTGEVKVSPLRALVAKTFVPNHAYTFVVESKQKALEKQLPVIQGKKPIRGKTTAYVCRGPICSLPITEAPKLKVELGKVEPYRTVFASLK